MLAQNFMTPAALGISDVEFEALVKVLGMLERGELKHQSTTSAEVLPYGFNLGLWRATTACGTVACIAGWADHLFGSNFSNRRESDPQLVELFTPRIDQCSVTVSQAAIALRNYLTHGEPRWAEALAE